MKTIDTVLDYWNNGKNCARATGAGILKANNDKDYPVLLATFTVYGGGMGEGSVCGAVSGSIGAVSKLLSDLGHDDDFIRTKINDLKSDLKIHFERDSIDCKVMLKEFADDSNVVDYQHPHRRDKCTSVIEWITAYAQNLVDNSK